MTDEMLPESGGDDAVGPAAADDSPPPTLDRGDASLLALVDRLAGLLDRSDLSELEVESGGTALVLRKPVAIATSSSAAVVAAPVADTAPAAASDAPAAKPSVKAPLTGIFYASPAPGSPPYVQAGNEIAVGQVIGLIEAMKLFNEIKSDIAGRVVRVVAESGQLVKSKQPLVEVDPL
jgi:acetyl-CoA carboxylase biotin carboxyl carrier protein